LVDIAAIESEVKKVIEVAKVTISSVHKKPTLPTTHPKRRYIITPRIVSIEGVKTPPKVFNPAFLCNCFFAIILVFNNCLTKISFLLKKI